MSYKTLESNFEKVELKEFVEYITRKIPIKNCSKNTYISTTNMLPNKRGITKIQSIPKTKTVNSFKKNDVLISNIRPYFKKIWLADFDGTNSSDVLVIRGNKKIIPQYLYYTLSDDMFFDYSTKSAKGTKMPRGDKESILKYQIPKLNLKEQKAIADTLSALDNKIELNNKINKNLEEQAQLLFKHWFVDFEFPNEEGLPYKSNGGEMIESELGLIPKGWEIKRLKDIVNENRRGISPKYNEDGQGVPVINQRCIRNYKITEEAIRYHDNSVTDARDVFYFQPYDVLINSMGVGTLGRIAQVTRLRKTMLIHSCITILRANNEVIMPSLLGYTVKSQQNQIKQMGSGSTGQTSLRKKDLEELKFVLPPIEIQSNLTKIFNEILIKKDNLKEQNEKLSKLRDTLLPKLMSGEIRIPLD